MALAYDGAIQRLIDAFGRLPGIGPKGAQRIAFYMLSAPEDEARDLAEAIEEVKAKIRFCDICGNVCESSPCPVCADPRRDRSVICVVEEPKDVMSIERTREYHGLYHVLGGAINPMANVGPADLRIPGLLKRLEGDEVKEVIMALDPNIEGEATTSYLTQLLRPVGVKVTRLASGLPVGGKSTHSVITGHRGLVEALMFTRLDEVKEGDFFYIEVMGETLGYKVDRISVILPDDTSKLKIVPGEDRVTLMTCTPYGVNTHRLLISGHRVAIPMPAPEPNDVLDARNIALGVGLGILAAGLFIIWLARRHKAARIIRHGAFWPWMRRKGESANDTLA